MLKKYIKYYLSIAKINFMQQMNYRGNFVIWSFVHTISLITNIVFFQIVFSQIVSINGWEINQVLLVLGVGTLITGIGSLTFFPFMYTFGREILKGSFDVKLTRPLDPHFQAAIPYIDVEDLFTIPIAVLLIIYSLVKLETTVTPVNFIGFVLLLTNGLVILFSILTFIESLAFKAVQVDSSRHLFWSFVNMVKYPAKSIENVSTTAAIFLFPTAIISSVPSEVLFGRIQPLWIISSFLLGLTLFVTSRYVFMRSLRSYTSASS